MRTLVLLLALAALSAGCPAASSSAGSNTGPASQPTKPTATAPAATTPAAQPPVVTPEAPRPPSSTSTAMQHHDQLAESARAAAVAGDLESFRVAMDYAAMQPLPGQHADKGAVFVERAERGALAPDLNAAAASVGEVGAACAACHRVHPQGRFAPSGFEEGDANLPERMQLHWWATDALWQGLVGPSDVAWKVGARTLADPKLKAVPGFPDKPIAQGYADALRKSASNAQTATTDEERGEALGQIIATCAGCHTALGRGPGLEREP